MGRIRQTLIACCRFTTRGGPLLLVRWPVVEIPRGGQMANIARANAAAEMGEQYSLARILGIWALATIPMGILSWIIFPAVSPDFNSDPLGAGVTRLLLLAIGLIWLFVLSMIIV